MLNRLLEYNYSAVFIFLFAMIIKGVLFYTGQTYSPESVSSLFRVLPSMPLLSGILASAFSVLMGGLILVISERFAKRSDFSLWLILIFVIQMSFYSLYSLTLEYFAVFLFIFSVFLFFRGINNLDKRKSIPDSFNLAFVLALSCLFSPHMIFILPFFWLSRIIIGQGTLRGFLASLLGFVLPFLMIDSLRFVFFDADSYYVNDHIFRVFMEGGGALTSLQWSWTMLSNIGPMVLLIVSLFYSFSRELSMKTLIRKFNQVNAIMLMYLIVVLAFGLVPMHLGMMMIFVPSAYFYSNFQSLSNRRWRNVYIIVMLFSALISYPVIINGIVDFFTLLFMPSGV